MRNFIPTSQFQKTILFAKINGPIFSLIVIIVQKIKLCLILFLQRENKKPVQKTNLDVKGPMTPKSHNGQICFTFAVIKTDSKEI